MPATPSAVATTQGDADGVALRRCINERSDGERIEAAFATTADAVDEWLDEIDGPGHGPEIGLGRAAVSLCYFRGAYPASMPAGTNLRYTRRVAIVPHGTRGPTLFIGPGEKDPTAPPGAVRLDDR